MMNLPSALANPIFVFKSKGDTISVLTELQNSKGENLFVAIELGSNKQMGHEILDVNDILTIHGRETENVINPIVENGSLIWVDKEKGLRWLSAAKSNSQAIANEVLDYATNIAKNFGFCTKEIALCFVLFRVLFLCNVLIFCGVAGFRTLVQTRNQYAFYMLSRLLVFIDRPERGTQAIA